MEKIRIQKAEARSQGIRRRSGITPPSNYGQRDNGWTMSMQMPIFKGFLNAYPLSNLVGQRDSGQIRISPTYSFQRSTGCRGLMEMPLFKGFNERPSVGTPVVQRSTGWSYPAYAPTLPSPKLGGRVGWGLCVSGRNAIHFRRLSRVDRPSRPLSEMAGRGVKEAKTPIFIGSCGEDPPRQPPLFGGGEGHLAISIQGTFERISGGTPRCPTVQR